MTGMFILTPGKHSAPSQLLHKSLHNHSQMLVLPPELNKTAHTSKQQHKIM